MNCVWPSLVLVALLGGEPAAAFAQLTVGKEKTSVEFKGEVGVRGAFSPDGKIYAYPSGVGGGFEVYDVTTGKLIASVDTPPWGESRPVTFSADGALLAVGGGDGNPGQGGAVTIWSINTRKQVTVLRLPNVYSLAFHPDGKTLAVSTTNGISFWDVATGRERAFFRAETGASVRYSSDGKLLYVGSSGAAWDIETEKIQETPAHRIVSEIARRTGNTDHPPSLLGPNSTTLVTAVVGKGGTSAIKFWDVKAEKERATFEIEGKLRPFPASWSFSPDGKVLALALEKGIELVAVETGKRLATIEGGLFPIVFSKDGKTLTGFWVGRDRNSPTAIKVWELIGEKEPAK